MDTASQKLGNPDKTADPTPNEQPKTLIRSLLSIIPRRVKGHITADLLEMKNCGPQYQYQTFKYGHEVSHITHITQQQSRNITRATKNIPNTKLSIPSLYQIMLHTTPPLPYIKLPHPYSTKPTIHQAISKIHSPQGGSKKKK